MSAGESEKLRPKDLKILQTEDGYRYSIDPFLLAAFVSLSAGANVVDLGSGSGVIALLLSTSGRISGALAAYCCVEWFSGSDQNCAGGCSGFTCEPHAWVF
jgi:hypothetical protein